MKKVMIVLLLGIFLFGVVSAGDSYCEDTNIPEVKICYLYEGSPTIFNIRGQENGIIMADYNLEDYTIKLALNSRELNWVDSSEGMIIEKYFAFSIDYLDPGLFGDPLHSKVSVLTSHCEDEEEPISCWIIGKSELRTTLFGKTYQISQSSVDDQEIKLIVNGKETKLMAGEINSVKGLNMEVDQLNLEGYKMVMLEITKGELFFQKYLYYLIGAGILLFILIIILLSRKKKKSKIE